MRDLTRGNLSLKHDRRLADAPPREPAAERSRHVSEALADMERDMGAVPRFPWGVLDRAAGELMPGDVWVISAKTGQGKTLFVVNWVQALMVGVVRTPVAVAPLEIAPKDFLKRLACLRADLDPANVLRNRWVDLPPDAPERFALELERLGYPESLERLHVWDCPRMTRGQFVQLATRSASEGAKLIIVDHLLRMRHGSGENLFAEVSETVRVAKELAKELDVTIVFTSQQGRSKDGDRLARFTPPDLSALKGAGTIEEEADAVLFLWRPLKPGLTKSDREAFREGAVSLKDLLEPNRMCVTVGKHRIEGEALGQQVVLHVARGRVTELPRRLP